MRDALNATGRQVWFALCGWHTWYATDTAAGGGQAAGNSWRVGPDTGSGWGAVMTNVEAGLAVAAANVPGPQGSGGAWSDGSLLLNPGMGHGAADLMSDARHVSMFGLWCTLGFNLLLTGNLSALDPLVLETWGNEELIAVNQDAAGRNPVRVDGHGAACFHEGCRRRGGSAAAGAGAGNRSSGSHLGSGAYTQAVFAECGGEPTLQQWSRGEPMEGFWHNAATNMCLNVKGCGAEVIYDGCSTTGGTCAGPASYANEQFDLADDDDATAAGGDRGLRTRLAADSGAHRGLGQCATAGSSGALALAKCSGAGGAAGTNQQFAYSSDSKQLTAVVDGRCLTAAKPSPAPTPSAPATLVIARALADGGVALLLLNNGGADAGVVCGAACFAKAGVAPSAAAPVSVRDLYAHKSLAPLTAPFLNISLAANGASAVLKLGPG